MKTKLAAFFSAIASAACCASGLQDGFNSRVIKTIMPTGEVSAVVSPYSVSLTAGFLGDGMDVSAERVALSSKMGLGVTDFGMYFRNDIEQFAEWSQSNRVEVLFANSVWMRNYAVMSPEFHETAHRDYGIVFGPLIDADAVNAWSFARTDGLVEKALDGIDIACNTAIVSVSGFNGAWARPFPKAVPGTFHAPGGDVQVPMMADVRSVYALRRPGYTAFALPYRGEKHFLFVVLPKAGEFPGDVGEQLSEAELDVLDRALLPGYRPENDRGDLLPEVEGASVAVTRISLPKFRVETFADFMPALEGLGIQKKGYETICENTVLGMAVQRNVFETSETGGEVGKVELPAVKCDGEPPEIACDRPFVFLVRTVSHRTLLAGRYTGR